MGIILCVLVGLLAGIMANLIYPGPSKGGLLGAMALGVIGAVAGGFLASMVTGQGFPSSINLVSMAFAVLGTLPCCLAITPQPVRARYGVAPRGF